MKSKATFVRALAILLLISFFALVFSAITFGTHHCDHEESCAICAYQYEHRSELFIPVLCVCALLVALATLPPHFITGEELLALFSPVKFKVKLSD